MNDPSRLSDREVTDMLRRRSARPAPDGLASAILESLALERARHPGQPMGRSSKRPMMLLAAAALLVVGGALAAGAGILRLPTVTPPAPAPSFALVTTPAPIDPSPVTTASPDAVATPTPTTTPRASASQAPSPTPASLNLAWTNVVLDLQSPRLAWIGDRFVLTDTKSGTVRTSTDGADWQALQGDTAAAYVDLLRGPLASWQDDAVGWWNPQDEDGPEHTNMPPITARDVVQVLRGNGTPTSTTPFKGRIESIGIGPKGIVAQVHSHIDWDAWVTKKLGYTTPNQWVGSHLKKVDYRDGVLEIRLKNGRGFKVVWADQGFEPGDFQDGGLGWFSPDGEQWTLMAPDAELRSNLPTGGFGQVVGVSDGFIATGAYPDGACADPNGSCTGMWYSSDGLTWRLLGTTTEISGGLVPWKGGALATDPDGRLELWTSAGAAKLPMAAQVHGIVATGPLGLVSMDDGQRPRDDSPDGQQVLVSRDGIDFLISPIPAHMTDAPNGRTNRPDVVAVGDQTVVVLESYFEKEFAPRTSSLWLGTFQP